MGLYIHLQKLRESAYVALPSRKSDSSAISFNALVVKQISAIAAYAGLSVEVKESTSNIIKTPTLTSKDGFSVFEASAIGRYSESYCLALHEEVKRRRLSQTSPTPIHVNGKHEGPVLSDCLLGARNLYTVLFPAPDNGFRATAFRR